MAITSGVANQTLTAAMYNQIKDHLEGASGSTLAWFFRMVAGSDLLIRLPDAAGARSFRIQDSAGVAVFTVDSDGNTVASGTLAVTGAVTLTVPLGVAQGGTGLATFTAAGAIPYATGATTLAALAAGTARQGLIMNAGATAPSWAASLQSLMTGTGDLVYSSGANTPARLAIGAAAQVLTVSAGLPSWGSGGTTITTVRKTVNETVNNSAALQNDDELLFAAAANTNYIALFYLYVTVASASDFQCSITTPAGATLMAGWVAPWSTDNSGSRAITSSGGQLASLYTSGGSEAGILFVDVRNAGNAGNVTLQWAQYTAVAENTIVNANSFLDYHTY